MTSRVCCGIVAANRMLYCSVESMDLRNDMQSRFRAIARLCQRISPYFSVDIFGPLDQRAYQYVSKLHERREYEGIGMPLISHFASKKLRESYDRTRGV
jgi:hypothetical protein